MLRKVDDWLPLWMNEGLAQFYENTDIEGKNAWLGQANTGELRYLNLNEMLPIATLLAVDRKSPYYHEEQKGSIFYAQSWALVHFLIVSDRIQGTHRVHDYAQRLAEGEDAVEAARHAFGDLNTLEDALRGYVAQRHFLYFMMPAELTAKDAEQDVRLVPTAEADAVRADVLLYTGRTQEARALVESALRDDPDRALAHETMGFLHYGAGDIAGAKKWYSEAAALDGKSYIARYYYAAMMLREGGEGEEPAIESNLQAAIRINPEFAPAYDALAMFYATRHRNLDEAHTLNQRAVELEPAKLGYRLNCAAVLAEDRQFGEAITVLKAALHVARTQDEIASVEIRIGRVEQYRAAMATAYDRARNVPGTLNPVHLTELPQ